MRNITRTDLREKDGDRFIVPRWIAWSGKMNLFSLSHKSLRLVLNKDGVSLRRWADNFYMSIGAE